MSDSVKQFIGGLAVGFVILLAIASPLQTVDSSNEPLPPTQLDLRPIFERNGNVGERREHAQALAEVMAIVAEGVEFDGELEGRERVYNTGATVDEQIVVIRKFYTQRWTFSERYPALGKTIGEYLKARLGKDLGDTLTDERRSEWIQALREVQASALQI
ncbi:MAG: hypothetical protein K8U03_09330 [Planctomycetia bacterium]|nr:hypothetical protein [Planctomycetia bacterium]